MADENDVDDIPRQLPDELLIEILARMPVKSLIKFTCVCKLWQSLIKSPEFAAKQYATRTLALSNYDCHHFMIHSSQWSSVNDITFLSCQTLDISTVYECKPVIYQPPPGGHRDLDRDFAWVFYGPCNGIFCIQIWRPRHVLVLWNPSTRQVFRTACHKKYGLTPPLVGFGFDANSNDYKIITCKSNYRRGHPYRIQLYSLAGNSWKDMEDSTLTLSCSGSHCPFTSSASSNGRMCNWLGFKDRTSTEHNEQHSLLSFDMVDEVFVLTPIPNGIVENILQCSFVQQRSHLPHPAIVSYGVDEPWKRVTFVNVWILQEYGASGYWTKHLSVMLPDHIIVAQPIGFPKAGEVLFMDNWEDRVLICYNYITQETKTMNSIQIDKYDKLYGYRESLFPIQTLGDCKDLDPEFDYYCLCEVNQQPLCSNSCIF